QLRIRPSAEVDGGTGGRRGPSLSPAARDPRQEKRRRRRPRVSAFFVAGTAPWKEQRPPQPDSVLLESVLRIEGLDAALEDVETDVRLVLSEDQGRGEADRRHATREQEQAAPEGELLELGHV